VNGDRLDLDLSGVALRVEGIGASWCGWLREHWGPFVGSGPCDPFLTVVVEEGAAKLEGDWDPKSMRSTLSALGARYTLAEGSAHVDGSGRATVRLAAGLQQRGYWAMQNLIRACLAWSLPGRGGALLHAAGLVVDGRAFVMVGAEGAGKTTWSALGARDGAHVVSDDLVLIDGVGAQPVVAGAPFRSTAQGELRPGRWPLAALLFPHHGTSTAVAPIPVMLGQARVAANLPFIAEGIEQDARIGDLVERLAGETPCAQLTFGLEGSFLPALRSWPRR